MEKAEFKPEPLSCTTMDDGQLSPESSGDVTNSDNEPKPDPTSRTMENEADLETFTSTGHLENSDRFVPEVSSGSTEKIFKLETDDVRNRDLVVSETLYDDMTTSDKHAPEALHNDMKHGDQCIRETLCAEIKNSDHFVPETSYMRKTDQLRSETSHTDMSKDDRLESEASHTDMSKDDRLESEASNDDTRYCSQLMDDTSRTSMTNCEEFHPENNNNMETLSQFGTNVFCSDIKYVRQKYEQINYNDLPNLEFSDLEIGIDCPSSFETVDFDMRNDGHSNYENQDSDLRIDDQSCSEALDSDLRNDSHQKCDLPEENKSNNRYSEGEQSLQHCECSTLDNNIVSEVSPQSFPGETDNFLQSNNNKFTCDAPSNSTDNWGSSEFSHASKFTPFLDPMLPVSQSSSFADDSIDSCITTIQTARSPLETHTETYSKRLKQKETPKIYPDINSIACNQNETPKCIHETDSKKYKNSETPKLYPDLDSLLYKQSEHLEFYSQTDIKQCNLTRDITESTVRKREILSLKMNENYNKSMNSLEVEQTINWKLIVAVLVAFFLVVVVSVAVYSVFLSSPTRDDTSPFKKFISHVRDLERTFPGQSEHLWKTVRASAFSTTRKDESKHPAVLLVATSTLHASVALCIAKHISASFELSRGLSQNTSLIDINHIKHLDAANQKLQLDNILYSTFSFSKRKSFIIENLQFLDPTAALMFYNYCDSTNALFKDVMILLMLHFDEKEVRDQSPSTVENYLEKMWSRGLVEDKVKPLMSRVANHIVIVKGESSVPLSDLCT